MPKWVLIKSALFKLILPIIFFSFSNGDQPSISNLIVKDTETGIEIKFLFSNIIDNNNIKGWIDREKWIVLNMYNVQLPKNNFFDQYISYPIQSIEHNMSVDAVQVSIQLVRRLEAFDIIRHLNTQEVLIRIMYDHDTYDYSIMDETEKSFIFPDIFSVICVLINPGDTQLRVIFFFAYSIANDFVIPIIPALDAE